jgi:hypothetical protein
MEFFKIKYVALNDVMLMPLIVRLEALLFLCLKIRHFIAAISGTIFTADFG